MSDTVYVEMIAEQRVRLSKFVHMKKEDWEEYNRLINNHDMKGFEIDDAINDIAERYGLDTETPHDADELEDTEFRLVDDGAAQEG